MLSGSRPTTVGSWMRIGLPPSSGTRRTDSAGAAEDADGSDGVAVWALAAGTTGVAGAAGALAGAAALAALPALCPVCPEVTLDGLATRLVRGCAGTGPSLSRLS